METLIKILGRIVPPKKRAKFVPQLGLAYEVDGRLFTINGMARTYDVTSGRETLEVVFVPVEESKDV